jgi:hypothetical protein
MTRLLQRLLDPAYLYAIDPGPLGRWKLIYVAWAVALALAGTVALWRRRTDNRRTATIAAGACGMGLLFLVARLLAPLVARSAAPGLPLLEARMLLFDVWTARVWPLSATVVAVLVPLAGAASRWCRRGPRLLQCQVDALTGALDHGDPPLALWERGGLAAVHLLGLACLWHSAGRSM